MTQEHTYEKTTFTKLTKETYFNQIYCFVGGGGWQHIRTNNT